MRAWSASSSTRISPTPRSSSVWLTRAAPLDAAACRRCPGTATTSSPRTTSGHASRSERGIFASTNTSCTFLRRPASRSPARQPRTWSPASSDSDRPRAPPHRAVEPTGPGSSQSRSYSRTACTPPPRSTRFEPAGEASSSASAGGSGRALLERAEQVLVGGRVEPARAAAGSRRGSGRASCRRSRSRRGTRRPSARSTPVGLLAPERQQRADDAVLAARLDPGRVPARDEPVEDGLDLVGGGVAGRAQPVRRERVAQLAQLGLARPRAARSTTSAPSTSRQWRASSSDSSPRRPWFTWSAETR